MALHKLSKNVVIVTKVDDPVRLEISQSYRC